MGTIASAGLTQADALRLGRVIGALAAAGLIDECYVFVRASELSAIPSGSAASHCTGGVTPPRAPRRSPPPGGRGSARRP
jgi:hypothetical protein